MQRLLSPPTDSSHKRTVAVDGDRFPSRPSTVIVYFVVQLAKIMLSGTLRLFRNFPETIDSSYIGGLPRGAIACRFGQIEYQSGSLAVMVGRIKQLDDNPVDDVATIRLQLVGEGEFNVAQCHIEITEQRLQLSDAVRFAGWSGRFR